MDNVELDVQPFPKQEMKRVSETWTIEIDHLEGPITLVKDRRVRSRPINRDDPHAKSPAVESLSLTMGLLDLGPALNE